MGQSLRISFVVPVLNEIVSVRKTVERIHELAAQHLHEILIVVAVRTTPESLKVVEELQAAYPEKIRVHTQKLPFLGGAMQEAFELVEGDHVMLMSSDLETDPALIPAFVRKMQDGGWDIVAGSRWLRGGGFEGYSRVKLLLNYVFQWIFRTLYFTRLTDLTFAYRLYRKEVLQNIAWSELKHPFLLECLIKPLRLGARATEIPCSWKTRVEGTSANSLLQTFIYLRIAFKARFMLRSRLVRKPIG